MDENPYQAPLEEGTPVTTAPPPLGKRVWICGVCLTFAALFAFMFFGGLGRSDGSFLGYVFLGWAFFTSAGFLATAVGFVFWWRPLVATGACAVIGATVTMFTLVIRAAR